MTENKEIEKNVMNGIDIAIRIFEEKIAKSKTPDDKEFYLDVINDIKKYKNLDLKIRYHVRLNIPSLQTYLAQKNHTKQKIQSFINMKEELSDMKPFNWYVGRIESITFNLSSAIDIKKRHIKTLRKYTKKGDFFEGKTIEQISEHIWISHVLFDIRIMDKTQCDLDDLDPELIDEFLDL